MGVERIPATRGHPEEEIVNDDRDGAVVDDGVDTPGIEPDGYGRSDEES